jgi:hypothetical protein
VEIMAKTTRMMGLFIFSRLPDRVSLSILFKSDRLVHIAPPLI